VFAGTREDKVVKLRVVFLDDTPEVDRSAGKPEGSAPKPYSPKTRFVVGEAITHVTFGSGVVIRVLDTKVDVRFADTTRTLVHARK
jgi:hypothetical protein